MTGSVANAIEETHRSPLTTGLPFASHVIVSVPCSSVRHIDAPVTAASASAVGSGCPYGLGCLWTFTGTNTGPGGTGNAVRVDGFESWRIDEDGLIAASIGSYDAEEYARQLAEGV